jgi:hypothetical protein
LELEPEPDFFPPRLDEPGELAIRAARDLDIPFFFRPSYCFSFFTFALLLGMLITPLRTINIVLSVPPQRAKKTKGCRRHASVQETRPRSAKCRENALCGKNRADAACETTPWLLHFRSSKSETRGFGVKNQALYEKLERKVDGGASLSELEAEIGHESRLLTEVEREEAWLYAWALRKRQARRPLRSVWEVEQGHGYAGDAGAR